MSRKLIYRFGLGGADGRAAWGSLLGGKGANLAEMAAMGINVPPGFTITTEACVDYLREGRLPAGLEEALEESLHWLEQGTGKQLGSATNPLLVSVRSGAARSMPGMMDTVLNLGLNDQTVRALATYSKQERFAYDAYRRFLAMFGDVVLGIEHGQFEQELDKARRVVCRRRGIEVPSDREALARKIPDSVLEAHDLLQVVKTYHEILTVHGTPLPNDPREQLRAAITAVFASWNNPRARLYRQMHGIPNDWGTAVNVQAMVFGNLGDTSATGVAFTRDPSTGERRFYGEWLPNAQGEDVVAGTRTPQPLAKTAESAGQSLEEAMPTSYRELFEVQDKLERHFRDLQDLEFTIEDGTLYLLQTRNGKRSARASVKIAVDMVHEGLLVPNEALLRVEAQRLQELLFPTVDPKRAPPALAKGLPAAPGATRGQIVFTADEAMKRAAQGHDTLLVRTETSPEDLHGMKAAKGILTARGGATSHAAVVARGMGRPCVAGCSALHIDEEAAVLEVYGPDGRVVRSLSQGDVITIDGSTGLVYEGEVPTLDAGLSPEMNTLLAWSERVRRLRVRANADTPAQAAKALSFGAEGIGLCRTEHMFFDDERIAAVREMILAGDTPARQRALAKVLPFQVQDFVELFRIMSGKPVNIRLLDPPLHEFLPHDRQQIADLGRSMNVPPETIDRKLEELAEFNPMLGHRGVRLAITYPEIAEMQVRAILEAACTVTLERCEVLPEIMVPLAFSRAELAKLRALVQRVSEQVFAERGCRVAFKFGTMIELPRAALLADQLAHEAEFFSFGTNDLTQMTLGVSRDDSGSFLPVYVEQGLLQDDPFVTLDTEGVGALMRLACERGRLTRPDLSLGICGEHGGDPASIAFCEQLGLGYVSCSPFRVPIARIAAAQAALVRAQAKSSHPPAPGSAPDLAGPGQVSVH